MKSKAMKLLNLDKKGWLRVAAIVVIAIIGIYCAVALFGNYSDISRLKVRANEVNARYSEQVNENEKIKAILDSENKDEYIEQKAREKGYAKDGEIVFYDISSGD
ncbi:MAG: septum formation initiator family protein [Eubacterium sp.]|nr:septum formation initiator family protein [Eubacterium sp.]